MSFRACDSCRRRKVRCDRGTPCRQCEQARLACTYEHNTSRFRLIQPKDDGEEPASPSSGTFSLPSSPTFGHQWFLTPDLVEASISAFFGTLYAVMPIISKVWIKERAAEIHSSPESYCLLGALCALTLTRCGMSMPTGFNHYNPHASPETKTQTSQSHGSRLLQDMIMKRESLGYRKKPQTTTVLTSYLIYVIQCDLGNEKKASDYLRESICLAKKLGIHEERSYSLPESMIDKINRRLFWILYVSERTQALQSPDELAFEDTIALPALERPIFDGIGALRHLISLYRISSVELLRVWNGVETQNVIQPTDTTESWLTELRSQVSSAIPQGAVLDLGELEVRLTQIWLRYIIWQLSITHGTLMRSAPDESMQFDYPVTLASQLYELTSNVTFESLEVRGTGFTRKLFDIAGAVLDVLNTMPFPVDASSRIHGYLNHIQTLIEAVNPNQCRYKDILRERLAEAHIAFANGQGLVLSHQCVAQVSSPEVANYDGEFMGGVIDDSYDSINL